MLERRRVDLVRPPAPQHRAIELQRLADFPQALDDRLVDAVGVDGAEPDGHVGDEPLKAEMSGRRRQASLEASRPVRSSTDTITRRVVRSSKTLRPTSSGTSVRPNALDRPPREGGVAVRVVPERRPLTGDRRRIGPGSSRETG
jgi:hypothetical protein